MTTLVRFLISNFLIGFTVGLVVGAVYMMSQGLSSLVFDQPLAAAMLMWAYGASFGLGSIGTGLAMIDRD